MRPNFEVVDDGVAREANKVLKAEVELEVPGLH